MVKFNIKFITSIHGVLQEVALSEKDILNDECYCVTSLKLITKTQRKLCYVHDAGKYFLHPNLDKLNNLILDNLGLKNKNSKLDETGAVIPIKNHLEFNLVGLGCVYHLYYVRKNDWKEICGETENLEKRFEKMLNSLTQMSVTQWLENTCLPLEKFIFPALEKVVKSNKNLNALSTLTKKGMIPNMKNSKLLN